MPRSARFYVVSNLPEYCGATKPARNAAIVASCACPWAVPPVRAFSLDLALLEMVWCQNTASGARFRLLDAEEYRHQSNERGVAELVRDHWQGEERVRCRWCEHE
jgi:hypothetical protein